MEGKTFLILAVVSEILLGVMAIVVLIHGMFYLSFSMLYTLAHFILAMVLLVMGMLIFVIVEYTTEVKKK